jgi:hypothetical protein
MARFAVVVGQQCRRTIHRPGKLSVEWDRIYGDGFFVANILGSPVFARADLIGNHGTTLNVEFYAPVPGQMINVKGIAIDSQGDLFKLTF